MKPFQEAVRPIYIKMEEVMGAEIINDIQQLLKDYRSKKGSTFSSQKCTINHRIIMTICRMTN
ncbi:hypothetical protein RCO48_08005 [Peribacillus frigoritolerans]|nr:hypothetical protein [Peribacillus frigoritolerans]